jgi:hypothetical protein
MAGRYAGELEKFPDAMKLYAPGDSADLRALKIQFYDAWSAWKRSGMDQRPPKESWETDGAGNLAAIDKDEFAYWKRNGWVSKLAGAPSPAASLKRYRFSLGDIIEDPDDDIPTGRKSRKKSALPDEYEDNPAEELKSK